MLPESETLAGESSRPWAVSPRAKTKTPTRTRKRKCPMKLVPIACLLSFSFAACVTVNVNFPESAVQKATDDYVRDLYRAKEKGKPAAPAAKKESSFEMPSLINSAMADDDVFKVSTDKAL